MFSASLAWSQESATQQQIDKLSGQIQDLLEAQAQQGKRLDQIERDITELREKVNTPVVNDSASRSDLEKLARQVQEIDQKRQDDREMIIKQIDQLSNQIGKMAILPPPSTGHHTTSERHSDGDTPTPTPNVPQTGYDYVVKQGDTLGLIVKAYKDKGVKVTKSQVIAANPKMNPDVLIPGKKIFIPDASAK